MRFANPYLIRANFDKLLVIAACAGYSLKDQLKAQRQEKGHAAYSIRSSSNERAMPASPAPCSNTVTKLSEDKPTGASPCSVKVTNTANACTAAAPRACSPSNKAKDDKCDFEARSPVADQLNEFKKSKTSAGCMTTSAGAIIGSKTAAVTVGPRGSMLLQDFVYMDEMAHFNRERIPERVVHAKGTGAFGQFEVTHDITKYCKASMFKVGKKTPVAVRFSTFSGEQGSADTVRDPVGFSIKFYTEEGNFDIVGCNTPVFFIRDPIHFPSLAHSQKRNPVTHLKDLDMYWDFVSQRPETMHQILMLYSDRGLPDGFRHMHGFGNHTYRLVNKDGCVFYCKFHFKTNQGIQNLTPEEAQRIAGTDPDYAGRDLYNAICKKEYPCWSLYAQIISDDDARCARDWNPFDVTKTWSHEKYRLVPVGKLILNRNPKNYFTDVEQIAFSPAHMVPGIEPSPDKILQGRLMAYSDTHRYRLGVNYHQIPVNCPYRVKTGTYHRDGKMCVDCNGDGAPNYYPNFFNGPVDNCKYLETPMCVFGDATRYETCDDDNFSQATAFYKNVLQPEEQDRLACNIGNQLCFVHPCIRNKALENFACVDEDLVKKIRAVIGLPDPSEEAANGGVNGEAKK